MKNREVLKMINKGLVYEAKIRSELTKRGLMPPHLYGYCTAYRNDAAFVYKGTDYFLEVKNRSAPDYGAKKIIYDPFQKIWKWNETDDVSDMFDSYGVLEKIPKFEPRKHVKADHLLKDDDKKHDRQNFRKVIELGKSGAYLIHEYYAKKLCHYIQIEGKGFYHLTGDPAGLGVPQFTPEVTIRLRAKTHSSSPPSNYSFRAVLVGKMNSIPPSNYDIEGAAKTFPIK